MNEQSYFHWDLFRQPIHSPSFAMGSSFLDIRDETMRGLPQKAKAFSFDQSCALWSKDIGLDPGDGLQHVGGRVLEIRKEKSRDAARSRRGKENYEFYELAKLLPLPAAITSQLDKASIIRLSISYLKLRDYCGHGDPPWPRGDVPSLNKTVKGGQRRRNTAGMAPELFEMHQGAHILQSLDGFAFTLSNDGRFLYISETVSIYLGLSQVEMAGSSMFDYVHSKDHQELADHLGLGLASVQSTMMSPASPPLEAPVTSRATTPPINDRVPVMAPSIEEGVTRSFCIRMKSTLTKRGVHVRCSGFRVIQFIGQFRQQMNFGVGRKGQAPFLGLSGVAIALPPPTITELRLEADTFIMRLTTKLKIIYCENLISTLTDWKCEDLSGKDLYTFCHPGDVAGLKKTHTDLLSKGQVMSPSMRLLNKGGGYIWVAICATSLFNSKTSDDQTILAIVQTISVEHRGSVMDASHLSTTHEQLICDTSPNHEEESSSNDTIIMSTNKTHSPVADTKLLTSACTTPISEVVDSPSVFPDNVENDFLLDEQHGEIKHDKVSRRKADRPRKRKRDSDDALILTPDIVSHKDTKSNEKKLITEAGSVCDDLPSQNSIPTSPTTDYIADKTAPLQTSTTKSPQLPEDLSFRPIVEKHCLTDNDIQGSHHLNSSPMTSSVKELENVMNRHLPPRTVPGVFRTIDTDITKEYNECQKSAIQWSASHVTSSSATDQLAASAFLRQLYTTSRESVIRSNGRPNCFNGGEMNGLNMLTPPTPDICKDQLHLNIPQITLQSKNTYPVHKDTVSILSHPNEEFSMTPPSSVSPQEKMTSPFSVADVSPECLSMRIGNVNHIAPGKVQHFSSIIDSQNESLPKSPYLSVPTNQYTGHDINSFSHSPGAVGSVLYESRPPDHSMWYGAAYTS